MNQSTLSERAAKSALFILLTILATAFLAKSSLAGTGTFKDGKFNFCVSVRFDATPAELQLIRDTFARASQYLADATDGQHQFGTVSIVNNSGAGDQAEFWIRRTATVGQPDNSANATGGKYGYRHFHVNLFYPTNFSATNINYHALTIVHEFGHHAYNPFRNYTATIVVAIERRDPKALAELSIDSLDVTNGLCQKPSK